jgi:hypothetical protein
MNTTNQFLILVRETPVVDDTQAQPLTNTFMRFCAVCMEIMPHYCEATYCQCVVCETKTYRLSENGYIRRDTAIMLNWLVVVLVVLFVFLKNWKW